MTTIIGKIQDEEDEYDRLREREKNLPVKYCFNPGFEIKIMASNAILKGQAIMMVHPEDIMMVINSKI